MTKAGDIGTYSRAGRASSRASRASSRASRASRANSRNESRVYLEQIDV
jgi:hypothetical protein